MFQRTKFKAIRSTDIRIEWKGAGLVPSSPTEVFKHVPTNIFIFSHPIRTLPDQIALKNTLLKKLVFKKY